MLEELIGEPTRYLFFTGKGGVGKTSLSVATAIALADSGRRVLLVSTDPASNLSEVLESKVGIHPDPISGVEGLWAMDVDPLAAAAEYRERVVGPYRGILPEGVIAGIEEQLSGACTVEIAAFDRFTGLLVDASDYDHVVFDTAPTGHTLRLLALPGAWTEFLDTNSAGVTCIGPLSGLTEQRERYREALATLSNPLRTTVVLVSRPEADAIEEVLRSSIELTAAGLSNQRLVLNGIFTPSSTDPVALRFASRQQEVLGGIAKRFEGFEVGTVALQPYSPIGVASLRSFLRSDSGEVAAAGYSEAPSVEVDKFSELLDEIVASRRGLIMTVGKGGVGKTTIAGAIACAVAARGVEVVLSTTDPAAHLTGLLGGETLPEGLRVERIDPAEVTSSYAAEVVATLGPELEQEGLEVLMEDLRSPCTEEIAVFRAFADVVGRAQESVVVLDTAPSGHTLLLLDAAQGFEREVTRSGNEVPEAVSHLLKRLADPEFTKIVLVTLAEATPVNEAKAFQSDLRRAGIEPAAWVVNQCMRSIETSDPVLLGIGSNQERWIAAASAAATKMLLLVDWRGEAPVRASALQAMIA